MFCFKRCDYYLHPPQFFHYTTILERVTSNKRQCLINKTHLRLKVKKVLSKIKASYPRQFSKYYCRSENVHFFFSQIFRLTDFNIALHMSPRNAWCHWNYYDFYCNQGDREPVELDYFRDRQKCLLGNQCDNAIFLCGRHKMIEKSSRFVWQSRGWRSLRCHGCPECSWYFVNKDPPLDFFLPSLQW